MFLLDILHRCVFFLALFRMAAVGQYKYHVTCMGKKQVIQPATKADVVNVIKETFKIEQDSVLSLQAFDDEFQDWVDIDDTTTLQDKARLMATVETILVATPVNPVTFGDDDLALVTTMTVPPPASARTTESTGSATSDNSFVIS